MKNERLFLDTNIVLDLLTERHPFFKDAARIASLADLGKVMLVASALTYATVDYFLSRTLGSESSKDSLRKFRAISEISEVNELTIDKGLNSEFIDFEDSLQYYCALQANCTIIITRNGKDFTESALPVMTPQEYLLSVSKK
jgi:predicted nucleic acid-binding protein